MSKFRLRAPAILFLAFLCLLVLWPLLAWVGPASWKIDSFENRRLAAFPTEISIDWPRHFEDYLDDHLPNRSVLLGLNAWVKYNVFNTSPVDSVLVGKDGWLFHRMPDDVLEFEGRLKRQPYQIRRLRVVLEERRDWLAEHGIDYLVLIAPTKQTIYPEKMPNWLLPSGSERSRREMLKSELQHTGSTLELFDFAPALQEAKGQWGDALFYRHDSHWTYLGALQSYAALAKRYPKWFREPGNDWIEIQTPREGNLMHLMGLPGQVITPHPQPSRGFAARTLAPDTDLLKYMVKRGPVLVYQRPDAQGAHLYLMGDSFAGWDTDYLAENFSRTVLTNTWGDQWQRHEQFPIKNIEAEHPDLVIEQLVENRLDLGVHRNLLGDNVGENHPPNVRFSRLRRLLHSTGELAVSYRHLGDKLEISMPPTKAAGAYIVQLNLQVGEKTLVESLSPYPDAAAWNDPCRRNGELTRSTIEPGRFEVLLCAVPSPNVANVASLRLRLGSGGGVKVLGVAVATHPDVL